MVVDSSALVVIMDNEPERNRFNELIEAAPVTYICPVNALVTRIVLFVRSADSAALAPYSFLLESRMNV